jgi:hypothetical protein
MDGFGGKAIDKTFGTYNNSYLDSEHDHLYIINSHNHTHPSTQHSIPYTMFGSVSRTLMLLARTPLVPAAPSGPAMVELSNMSGPSRRPRAASRTLSCMSVRSGYNAYAMEGRRYASDKGRQELYSDESGSLGAGVGLFALSGVGFVQLTKQIDDVAHTDAAFDKNADPNSSAKKIEKEVSMPMRSGAEIRLAKTSPISHPPTQSTLRHPVSRERLEARTRSIHPSLTPRNSGSVPAK